MQTPIAIIRNPNRFVERLVVKVVEAPSPNRSGLDRPGESAGDQAGDEFAPVMAADCAREHTALAFQEAPRVDHNGHEELTLPRVKPKAARHSRGSH